MKVGDLVRCKLTKAANTVGLIIKIEPASDPWCIDAVQVLTGHRKVRWSAKRLEVINESR
jgi:hypothetical protein